MRRSQGKPNVPPHIRVGHLRKRTGWGGAAVADPEATSEYSNMLVDTALESRVLEAQRSVHTPRSEYNEGDGLEIETRTIFDKTLPVKLRPLDGPNRSSESGIDVTMQLQLVASIGIVPAGMGPDASSLLHDSSSAG